MFLNTPPGPAREVPVSDIVPGLGDAGDESSRVIAWEIHKACCDTGFFYVAGHGVPAALIAGQFDWARRFFALSLPAKLALHMNRSRSFAGYEPIAGQPLAADYQPDPKEGHY